MLTMFLIALVASYAAIVFVALGIYLDRASLVGKLSASRARRMAQARRIAKMEAAVRECFTPDIAATGKESLQLAAIETDDPRPLAVGGDAAS